MLAVAAEDPCTLSAGTLYQCFALHSNSPSDVCKPKACHCHRAPEDRRARRCRRLWLCLEGEQHGEHDVAADAEGQPSTSAASVSKEKVSRPVTGLLLSPAMAGHCTWFRDEHSGRLYVH